MEDPKKSPYNKTSKTAVINWWDKQQPKSKYLLIVIICLGLVVALGLSGLIWPDQKTQKINTINQMKTSLQSAAPIMNDFYDSLSGYDSGKIDSRTALNKLQADKSTIDGMISKMESKKPPNELQYPYSVTESALQDLSTSIGNGIDGINTNNFQEIEQEISLRNNLNKEFNEAADEVSKIPYPTS